jgi:hypothetical protein
MLVEQGLTQMRAWTPRLAIQAAVMTSLLDASLKQAARFAEHILTNSLRCRRIHIGGCSAS